jgi:hypothetical protein
MTQDTDAVKVSKGMYKNIWQDKIYQIEYKGQVEALTGMLAIISSLLLE